MQSPPIPATWNYWIRIVLSFVVLVFAGLVVTAPFTGILAAPTALLALLLVYPTIKRVSGVKRGIAITIAALAIVALALGLIIVGDGLYDR